MKKLMVFVRNFGEAAPRPFRRLRRLTGPATAGKAVPIEGLLPP
ncbi:hypothetical protein ACTTAF_07620 [Rhodobacter capsulatus]